MEDRQTVESDKHDLERVPVPDMCRIALDMRFRGRLTYIQLTVRFSVILGNGY